MNRTQMRARAVRQASRIERAHSWPKTQGYPVGQHTFNAVALLRILFPARADLLDAMLFHDVPELRTSDISARAKDELQIGEELERLERDTCELLDLACVHDLPPEDQLIIEAVDALELWLWTWDEQAAGNLAPLVMRENLDAWFERRQTLGTLPYVVFVFRTEFKKDGWTWLDL